MKLSEMNILSMGRQRKNKKQQHKKAQRQTLNRHRLRFNPSLLPEKVGFCVIHVFPHNILQNKQLFPFVAGLCEQ